jgi:uncharacterized DUF497 family protein
MTKWNQFVPEVIEYDFDSDELHAHRVSIDEAVQCFYNRFVIRRNKSFHDRFKLIGITDAGRHLCIIFQLKKKSTVRIITGWEV